MRTIAHISDLHFGRAEPDLADVLAAQLSELRPDLVAISGDFTQRAREHEFRQASDFLQKLSMTVIAVPGNHDVPLYSAIKRFHAPLALYNRYVSGDREPFYCDQEIAAVGVNTARSLTWKGGRINREQVDRSCRKLDECTGDVVRIIVTHHPFDLPESHRPRDLVGRARMAMIGFAACNVDVFLSGHLHLSGVTHTIDRYRIRGHSALVIQAGTAISTRARGEPNSWNLIRVAPHTLSLERFQWSFKESRFVAAEVRRFSKDVDGWIAAGQDLDDACSQRSA